MGFTDRFSVKVKDTTGEFTKGECMVHEEILDVEGRIVELVGHLISAQWDSPTLQKEMVRKSDFVLLPIPADGFSPVISYKSPNRVIDSIAQGRYVITTHGVISYDNYVKFIGMGSMKRNILWALDNPKSVISKIEEGIKAETFVYFNLCIGLDSLRITINTVLKIL